MKKKFTKSLVAMIALIAMLTQNAYGVYAAATSPAPIVENEYADEVSEPEIEVVAEDTTDAGEEYSEEGTEIEYVDGDVDVDEVAPTDDVNYDDQIMLLDEQTPAEEEITEEETPEEENIPEEIEILDTQISGSGLDELEFYIDTNRLNTGDTFRIIFTGASDARYDTRLNDNLDVNAQGVYRFLDLNKEGFNIRATSDDNVTFEFCNIDGMPAVKVVSVDSDADKMLYTKSITTDSGKPATAIFGEGYTNIAIKLDTKELSAKAEYTVYVDSKANVTIDGSECTSIDGTKEKSIIELSNLDKEQFTVYVVEKEGSEVTADASIDSVEEGNATLYISGDEVRTKREYTYSDSDVTVTATLQYADAVPDDADFVVTPITSKRAVDAYIDALNDADDGMSYTEENTLLYDVAFLVDKTDEDGNVIPGEKVEYEPEVGSVTVDIKFNKSQLTDELGVADSENITVNHLPLKSDVKNDVDTTVEATNISASDVIVEPMEATVAVKEGGTDEIKFVADSFSTYAISNVYGDTVKIKLNAPDGTYYATVGYYEENNGWGSYTYEADPVKVEVNGGTGEADIKLDKVKGTTRYVWNQEKNDNDVFVTPDKENAGIILLSPKPNANTSCDVYNIGGNFYAFEDGAYYNFQNKIEYKNYDSANKVQEINITGATGTVSLDTVREKLDEASNFMVVANDFNQRDHYEGNIAVNNFKPSGSPIGTNGTEQSIKLKITVKKTVAPAAAGTFDFGIFEIGKDNAIGKVSITTDSTGVGTATYTIEGAQNSYEVYELDSEGNKLQNNDRFNDYIVTYESSEGFNNIISNIGASSFARNIIGDTKALTANKATTLYTTTDGVTLQNGTVEKITSAAFDEMVDISGMLANAKSLSEILANARTNDSAVVYNFDVEKIDRSGLIANGGHINLPAVGSNQLLILNYIIPKDQTSFSLGSNINDYNVGSETLKLSGYETADGAKLSKRTIWNFVYPDGTPYSGTVYQEQNLAGTYLLSEGTLHAANSTPVALYASTVNQYSGHSEIHKGGFNFEVEKDARISVRNSKGEESGNSYEFNVTKDFVDSVTGESWPIDAEFTFTLEALNSNNCGTDNVVNDPAPIPIGAVNGVKTVTINGNTTDKTASFGIVDFAPDATENKHSKYVRTAEYAAANSWCKTVDNATVYPRCYMYKVTEVISNPITGVTYDTNNVRYIKLWVNTCVGENGNPTWVEIEANGSTDLAHCDGRLGDIVFHNKYTNPKGAIKVTKAVKAGNSDYETDEKFYFVVMKGNDQIGNVHEIVANETITVPDLALGTYTVVETDANGNAVSQDDSFKYEATVTPASVEVVANQTADAVPLTTITNKISIEPTSITIEGVKEVNISQYAIANGEFEFTLKALTANAPMPAGSSNGELTVSNDGRAFSFGEIEYTKDNIGKSYKYEVTESKINKAGFAPNTEKYTVTVAVTQSGNRVVATKSTTKGSTNVTDNVIKFTNNYTTNTSFEFEAKKTITGRNLSTEEFTFVLEGTNDNAKAKMPTGSENGKLIKKNQASQTNEDVINFGSVNFTQVDIGKEFTYQITEPGVDANGLVYDKTVYTISITPELDENNNLKLNKVATKTGTSTDASGYVDGNKICVLFNNTYTAGGKAALKFNKTVEGNVPEDKEFTFELYKKASGTETADTKIAETKITGPFPKPVVFENVEGLKFGTDDIGKTYNYYAKEFIPEAAKQNGNKLDGIEYSTAVHNFSIEVKDGSNGNLTFEVKKDGVVVGAGDSIGEFNNKYTVASVEVPVSGVKKLPGKTIEAEDYEFAIEAVSAVDDDQNAITPIPVPTEPTTKVTNAAGEFTFGNIEYTKVGTYVYKVTEVEPTAEADKKAGVKYDTSVYTVTIKIKDNGKGQLVQDGTTEVKRDGSIIEKLEIKNTYEAKGQAVIEAQKTINNGDYAIKAGVFAFGLYVDENGTKTALVNDVKKKPYVAYNDASGNVTFDAITYKLEELGEDKTEEYTYYVHEISTEEELKSLKLDNNVSILDGYDYDDGYYPVKVTVSDDGTGKLSVTKDYSANPDGKIVVNNSYSAKGSTAIHGIKTLQGREIKADDEFVFTLIAKSATDPNVTKTESGETNLTVDTVTVRGNEANKAGKIEFNFKDLNYTQTGTYEYTVKELVPTNKDKNIVYDITEHTVTVTVTDNGDGSLNVAPDKGLLKSPIEFLNKVPKSNGADFTVKKVLTGKAMTEREFSFTLKEVKESTLEPITSDEKDVRNQTKDSGAAAAGQSVSVAFDSISYNMEDAGRHVYEIAEVIPEKATLVEMENNVKKPVYKGVTYDDTKFYAIVNVSVNATNDAVVVDGPHYHKGSVDGTEVDAASVEFNNKYSGSTKVTFGGKKSLYLGEIKDGILGLGSTKIDTPDQKFEFILTAESTNSKMPTSAENGKITVKNNGSEFSFGEITYTAEDFEREGTIKIDDNHYMIRYTIEEQYAGQTIDGIKYDSKVYDAAVILSVDKNGNLKAEKVVKERTAEKATTEGLINSWKAMVSGNEDLVEFKNIYYASANLKLGVTKTLNGMNWGEATSFDFSIAEGTNVIAQAINGKEYITVTKDSTDATEYFNELTYDVNELGNSGSKEYTYTIKEVIPEEAKKNGNKLNGITYSDVKHEVVVTVTDSKDGTLNITATVDGNALDLTKDENNVFANAVNSIGFTNEYKPDEITAQIKGKKVLTNKTLGEGEFSFKLEAVTEGAPLPTETTVTNNGEGIFEFGEVTFTPEMMLGNNNVYLDTKVFAYKVTEVVPDDAETIKVDGKTFKRKGDVTYDSEPKTVTITVTNAGGKLTATVSPDVVGLQFTNSYNSKNGTTISAKKEVIGTSATDKEFTFILKSLTELDPNAVGKTDGVIDTKTAKNQETVTFTDLEYTLEKTIADAKSQGSTDNTAVYEYEVTEDQTNAPSGYTMSKQLYTARVSVTAKADGTLTVAPPVYVETKDKVGDASDKSVELPIFENSYDAEGNTTVDFTKVLKGRDIKALEFTFFLKNEAGDVCETETSVNATLGTDKTATNAYTFGGTEFKYDVEDLKEGSSYKDNKVLYYTIEEDIPDDAEDVKIDGKNYKKKGSIIYDNGIYVVAVFIDNPGAGELKVDRVVGRFETSREDAISSMKNIVAANWVTEKAFAENVTNVKKAPAFANTSVVITNEYKAEGQWDPRGKKILTGMPLEKDKMFNFLLDEYEVKDGVATNKVINTATGYNGGINHEQVIFDKNKVEFLKYNLDDVGLHVYKITESLPVKADKDGNVIKDGITYDTKEWTFNVTVADNGDGTLSVTCPEDINTGDVAFTFNNDYKANGSIDLYGAKVLEGADFDDVDKFEFAIKEVTPGMESAEFKVNNDNARIAFSHEAVSILNYEVKDNDRSDVTDHKYEIYETTKSGNGLTCDTKVYTVTVGVTDNGDGTLATEIKSVTYPLNEGKGTGYYDISADKSAPCFSFKNEYEAKAELLFKGVKHLRNAELSTEDIVNASELDGKYTFSIYEYKSAEDRAIGVNGELVSRRSCNDKGEYTLQGRKFTQKDLEKVVEGKTIYEDSVDVFYQVVEVKPTEGTWDETRTVFTGADGVIYDNTVYNVDVKVIRADKGSDKLKIEVKNHDDNSVINAVADANNVYTVGDTDAQRAAKADKIGYFDFKNIKPQTLRIDGTKTWNDGGKDANTRPDVIIELKSSEDNFTAVLDTYTIKAPATTYFFDKLPATDKYGRKITYDTFERETAELKDYFSQKDGFNFINTQGDVVINKIDADTKLPVEGAVLAILDGANEVERWTTTRVAHVVTAKLTPGKTYTLTEITAPSGYLLADNVTFTVPSAGGSIEVTMEDKAIRGNVRLRKLDSATRETLSGAEFALYTEAGERVYASGTPGSYEYSRTSSNGRFVVNTAGELMVTGLPYGTYYFTELAAPAGYLRSSERLGFTVLNNGETLEVTFLNTKETGSVRLRKTNADGSVSLSGAVFELYARTPSSASAAIASTIYRDAYYRVGTYTTDAAGMIYVGDLPWDDYYFVEVQAPEGYEITTDVNGDPIAYTFTIGEGGTARVSYDIGRITNSTTPTTPPTPSTPPTRGEVRGSRAPRDTGRLAGGVLSGVLGVRAKPKQGVLGERLGPVTGDAANIFLWLVLLLASVGAIVGVMVANIRRKRNAVR